MYSSQSWAPLNQAAEAFPSIQPEAITILNLWLEAARTEEGPESFGVLAGMDLVQVAEPNVLALQGVLTETAQQKIDQSFAELNDPEVNIVDNHVCFTRFQSATPDLVALMKVLASNGAGGVLSQPAFTESATFRSQAVSSSMYANPNGPYRPHADYNEGSTVLFNLVAEGEDQPSMHYIVGEKDEQHRFPVTNSSLIVLASTYRYPQNPNHSPYITTELHGVELPLSQEGVYQERRVRMMTIGFPGNPID